MKFGSLTVFVGMCGFAIAKSSYLVSAPILVRPGTAYAFSVSILKANGRVNIEASLISRTPDVTITSTSSSVISGKSVHMSVNVPKNLTSGHYALRVKGSGGLSFNRQTNLVLRENDVVVLIQTDKAIYSPDQKVRFRVAAMHLNLKPYTGFFDIKIYDAKDTLIQQWMAVNSNDGVFAAYFVINADPNLGHWKIKVSFKGNVSEKKISVKRYVLPKFNVNVIVGKSYILNSGPLTATINASYTYGKPVLGTAVVQFIKYPDKTVIKQDYLNITGPIKVSLPANKVSSSVKEIVVIAKLGEATTGTTVIESATVAIVKTFRLSFGPTRKAFSPGLPYTTFVKISSDVGSKVNQDDILRVKMSITNVVVKRCNVYRPYDYKSVTTSTVHNSISLGTNSSPKLTFATPSTATKINVVVTLRGVSETFVLYADHTKQRKHLQIIPKEPSAKVDNQYSIDVKLSYACNSQIMYQVISKGVQLLSGLVDCNGRSTIPLSFKVTSCMVPKAHVIVYTVFNGEIITDEIDLDVHGNPSLHKIQLNFKQKTVGPGETVKLDIQGSPNSKVHLLAVDESVNILQSGYDISIADVLQKLQSYDSVPAGYSTDIITKRDLFLQQQNLRTKRSISASVVNDAQDVFQISGLNIMSDADLYDYDATEYHRISKLKTFCKDNRPNTKRPSSVRFRLRFVRRSISGINKGLSGSGSSIDRVVANVVNNLTPISPQKTTTSKTTPPIKHQQLRREFPETWIWESVYLSNNGFTTLEKVIPDTITTWRASAFGIESGFGTTDTVSKITVYVPLFADLILPFKAVRNKQFVVKVPVYNYNQNSIQVMIMIFHTADPANRPSLGDKIDPGTSKVFNFVFEAKHGGESTVAVTLWNFDTFSIVDKIQKKMYIKDEGIEQEYNKQHWISVARGTTFTEQFNVILPPGYVQGSKRVYVTVSGKITAFVAMSFHQAKPYIYINENILLQAVNWIIRYQNIDGSFREPGRVIHTNMQGASSSSRTALTAYVLVALLEIDDIPSLKSKISRASEKAKKYIENRASSVVGDHALALCAYALKMAGSSRASFVFRKLEKKAIDKDEMRSWDSNLRTAKSGPWTSPNPRARPVDIETAAYALLYYVLDKDLSNGMKVLKWLTSQRNPTGGFASTQDTVVSLHAMTEFSAYMFASKSSQSKDMLNIDISSGNHQSTFTVNSLNRLQLQHKNLPDDTASVNIRATGDGMALVDVIVVYNIVKLTDTPAYNISSSIKNESFDSITVTICARRTKSGNSGMVVEEITIPSGFKADLTSIGSVNGLKQKEADLDKVVLYFDRVGSTSVCVDMKVDRVDKVIQSQTYPIEIYDYYDPRNQGVGNYTSGILANMKLCDVCPECYVCIHKTTWG